MCDRCSAPLSAGASFSQERRWVSVVFFDLSRFTEFSLAHPLEDTWKAANSALQIAANHARRFGGQIDKFLGDGFLAVFGVPKSQDSDATAALEAAKAMVDGSPLPARAGVASGLVLRTPLGGGLAGDQTVLGPTVNLSQRLSGAAPSGEVWADATTIKLSSLAKSVALEPQMLKGYPEPLIAFKYHGQNLNGAFIHGRKRELKMLQTFLEDFGGNKGKRVVIHGAMGIGKTYLVENFLKTLPDEYFGFFAPRFVANTNLRQALQQTLESLLHDDLVHIDSISLPRHLRPILDFSLGRIERPNLSAHELDQALVETWWKVLEGIAKSKPLVVVLDDLHNADPTVLEFTRRTPPDSVMMLLLSRQNRWDTSNDIEFIPLGGLPMRDRMTLIKLARPGIGIATTTHLAEISEGFPLAIQALSLTSTGEPESLPFFQSKMDALPKLARVAIQASAVLGSTVPPELVRHLVGEEADLARLVGEGFLDADKKGRLRFAVPFLRDAVLGQVGSAQAQTWHLQAAKWHQHHENFADAAVHLEAAGEPGTAFKLWRFVAQHVWREGRYKDAIEAFLEALRLADGGIRPVSAIELAEAYLALGEIPNATEMAQSALQNPSLTPSNRDRALAIVMLSQANIDRNEFAHFMETNYIANPRTRISMAWGAEPNWALKLLRDLPNDQSNFSHLPRALAHYRAGHFDLALSEIDIHFKQKINSPYSNFQAGILHSELFWRTLHLEEALKAVRSTAVEHLPRFCTITRNAQEAKLLLDSGEQESAYDLILKSEENLSHTPPQVAIQLSLVKLRYLIEAGKLPEALQFGQQAIAKNPDASDLLGALSMAYAISPGNREDQIFQRLIRAIEDSPLSFVRGCCAFSKALKTFRDPKVGAKHLLETVRISHRGRHPELFYFGILLLAAYWVDFHPKRARSLQEYLLRETEKNGFKVQHELAKLLSAEFSKDNPLEAKAYLDFSPSIPLTKLWHSSVVAKINKTPFEPVDESCDYGLIETWIRQLGRETVGETETSLQPK